MVEMLIDGIWTDLTTLGLVLSGNQVQISTKGRPGENSVSTAATCNFSAKNFNAAFSLANPTSTWYGKIGLGTQLRTAVPRGNGVSRRFWGELSVIPQETDITGQYSVINFEAAGMLRRLSQGEKSLRSPLYREKTNPYPLGAIGNPITTTAYWSMEDVSGSATLASAVTGGRAMTFTGTPDLATYTGFVCSDAIPNLNGASFSASVPSVTFDTSERESIQEVTFLLSAPSGITNGSTLAVISTDNNSLRTIKLSYPSTDHLQIIAYDSDAAIVYNSGSVAVPVAGQLLNIEISLDHVTNISGANGFYISLNTEEPGDVVSTNYIDSGALVSTGSSGCVRSINLNPSSVAMDVYMGHLSVHTVVRRATGTYSFDWSSLNAWLSETADKRFERLLREEHITHEVIGSRGPEVYIPLFQTFTFVGDESLTVLYPDNSLLLDDNGEGAAMGYQTTDTLMNLLRQCEATDDGIIYEMTNACGIGYRTRRDIQNQAAVVTLDHSNHELSAPLAPITDDSFVTNDVTATKIGGTSYNAVDTTSPRSVNQPPAGMGRYDTAPEFSVWKDVQAGYEAQWTLRKGTVNEARFKAVTVNLNSYELAGTTQRNAILDMVCGDRVVISNVPVKYGPDNISQLAVGFTETIDQYEHTIILNTVPESVYRTGVLGSSTKPRAGSSTSTLTQAIDPGTSSFLVTVAAGSAVWVDNATYASDFPFDIRINGEQMTVTGISGTTSPQTFTIFRAENGVVKGHPANSPVTLFVPAFVGM